MENNYSINRAIVVLLIAIHKLNKEIALLKIEMYNMESFEEPDSKFTYLTGATRVNALHPAR